MRPLFAIADLLDRFIAWARPRWQVEAHEHSLFPDFRLVLWARIKCDDAAYDYELFVIKLPSYEWKSTDYGNGPWRWHQGHLYRRGRRRTYKSQLEAPKWGIELVPDGSCF